MSGSNTSSASGDARESAESVEAEENNWDFYSYRTCEYDYKFTPTTFTKRELRLEERPISFVTGLPVKGPWSTERLQNSHDALKFIAENTTIPVPRILEFGKVDGVYELKVERIYNAMNLDMIEKNLSEEKAEEALKNADHFLRTEVLPQLRALKSPRIGTVGGIVIPPVRISGRDKRPFWAPKSSPNGTPEFSYCHNDLARHNILINWETLEVEAIIDWEYSGFYTPEFEEPLWTKSDRQDVHDMGREKIDSLIEFLADPAVRPNWN